MAAANSIVSNADLSSKPPSESQALLAPATRGKTFIADDVVSVIARIAAEQIEGVHQIGKSSFRSLISRLGRNHGVESDVGMKEAAVDLDVVVEFGYPIRDVARELRAQVIETVERMTGRTVVETNIHVVDVHIDKDESRHRRRLE